jgi:hypothetical protein
VVDHRIGDIPAVPSGDLGPPGQIHIFARIEEILIEEPDVLEERPPIGGRRPAGGEHLLLPVVLPDVRLPDPPVARDAVHPVVIAGGVEDLPPVEEQDLGGQQPGVGMAREGRCQRFEPGRRRLGVVVQEDQDLPAGSPDPGVDGPGETPVAPQCQDPHLGVASEQGEGAVGRAVVHHQDLPVGIRLPAQRLQAGRQMRGAVPVGDDHGEEGQVHPTSHPSSAR